MGFKFGQIVMGKLLKLLSLGGLAALGIKKMREYNTPKYTPVITIEELGVNESARPVWMDSRTYKRAEPYLKMLTNTERKYGIPGGVLVRLAYQESRFRQDIISGQTVSSANAQGLMQIVPRWHPDVNPLDTPAAIDYAGGYLARLYKSFGSWRKALAAYNWGPGNMRKTIASKGGAWLGYVPQETYNYVTQISNDTGIA